MAQASLENGKAQDIQVIDLRGKTVFAEFMVIASGASSRHVNAMTKHLCEKIKAGGVRNVSIEGAETGGWVLIDAGDVIVHIFRPEVREYYGLEKMWGGVTAKCASIS